MHTSGSRFVNQRPSTLYISFLCICLVLLGTLALHVSRGARSGAKKQEVRRQFVKSLSLTDLVLFTDARYTRHPTMSDLHTPFQDHPMSLEHFPSGTVIAPPEHLRTHGSF